MSLISKLYGFLHAPLFKEKWFHLVLDVANQGRIFNWSTTLSLNLYNNIRKVLELEENYLPNFYISSYVMDAICDAK